MKNLNIGIIGWGRFAKILTKYINQHLPQTQVLVSSRQNKVSLKNIADCQVIIPCVPISAFKSVIQKLAPLLKPNSLVIDVCSVKTHPVKIMKSQLPKNVNILATHPMWGPESARRSLKGLTTVLCPVRIPQTQLKLIKSGLKKLAKK